MASSLLHAFHTRSPSPNPWWLPVKLQRWTFSVLMASQFLRFLVILPLQIILRAQNTYLWNLCKEKTWVIFGLLCLDRSEELYFQSSCSLNLACSACSSQQVEVCTTAMICRGMRAESLFQALAQPVHSALAPILRLLYGMGKGWTCLLSVDHVSVSHWRFESWKMLTADSREDQDSLAVLTAGATKEITYLNRFGRALQPFQRLFREVYNYQAQSHLEHIINLKKYLQIAPHLVSPTTS